MAYYIDPAKKNYTAIKAAVDRHAVEYGPYFFMLGGAPAVAMTILTVVSAVPWITVSAAVTSAMQVFSKALMGQTAALAKTEEGIKKIMIQISIMR